MLFGEYRPFFPLITKGFIKPTSYCYWMIVPYPAWLDLLAHILNGAAHLNLLRGRVAGYQQGPHDVRLSKGGICGRYGVGVLLDVSS